MDEVDLEELRGRSTARSAASYSYIVTRGHRGILASCTELDALGEAESVAGAVGAMRSAIAKRLKAM